MIDFKRFWLDGSRRFEIFGRGPVSAAGVKPPGVSGQEIRKWEEKHGVKMPEPLLTALSLRNGGQVRNAPIEVRSLVGILPIADDSWLPDFEHEICDRRLLIAFGSEIETQGTLLMNFNARGPRAEPSVYISHDTLHGRTTFIYHDSISGLFEAELASTDEPSVDWSVTKSLSAVARETVDLSSMYDGRPASLDQVLAREGETLMLFSRERSPTDERLTRNMLPLPLDGRKAIIMPMKPTASETFGLWLDPVNPVDRSERAWVESHMSDDGRWKNVAHWGGSHAVYFFSMDRQRLHSLRTELFGAEISNQNVAWERDERPQRSML